MAVFKCKMCGGTLEINNETVEVCEHCGAPLNVPQEMDRVQKEAAYLTLKEVAQTSTDIDELISTAEKLDNLEDYRDSKNFALYCRRRANEEREKLEAEEKDRREQKERNLNAVIKHNKTVRNVWLISSLLVIVLSIGAIWTAFIGEGLVVSDVGAIIGCAIASVAVEAVFCGIVFVPTLLALVSSDPRKKFGKVMVIISRICAIPGVLMWGFLSLGVLIQPMEPLLVWAILSLVLNLISFVMPFFRKKLKV